MTPIKHPAISFSLVTAQFLLIGLLLLALPMQFALPAVAIQVVAATIGLWAVKVMHLGHFNIIPDPQPDIELITNGPYRWIRHPMYFSIILFFLPWVILNLNWITLSLYINLFIVLFIKLSYEENLLIEKIPEYKNYQKGTTKIIPFVL